MRARWIGFALLVVVLAGVAYWRRTREVEPRPPLPRRTIEFDEAWATTVLFERFEFSMPRSWFQNVQPAGEHGVLFFGAKDGVHAPTVQLNWRPWSSGFEAFFEFERDRRVPGVQDILEEGEAVVAGQPARYLVYEQESDVKGFVRPVKFLTIDWYFARDGRGGILRAVTTATNFRLKYRPIFTEIAKRLRYRPSR